MKGKEKRQSWLAKILYGDIPLEDTKLRFLLTVYFYGGFCGILAGISNLLLGLEPTLTYSVFAMGVLFFLLHRSLFLRWIGFLAGFRLFYFFSAVCFNTLWFFNAGVNGGIVIYFYLLVIVIMIYSESWERGINLTLTMLNILVLLFIDYNYPDWIVQFPSAFERYVDIYVSILMCLLVNYIAISVVLSALKRTNLDLEDKYTTIHKDLNLASKIQYAVMSPQFTGEGFEIGTIYKPLTGVGGDVFSMDEKGKNGIRIFLADATGHGVQAGLVTMLILSEYLAKSQEFDNPSELLQDMNESFIKRYSEIRAIFSCLVLDWDKDTNRIQFASAGHIPQWILRGTEQIVLEKTGPIIGLKKGAGYKTREIVTEEGDSVVLFTDGITEAFNPGKSMYGDSRMREFALANRVGQFSLQDYVQIWYQDLLEYVDGESLEDDLTILAIRRTSE